MTARPNLPGGGRPDFIPADACSRRIIEEDLDGTLFVEASAGTGKTTSLVKRVVNLVATGKTTLDRIAAITFTEAAASELRDRVRQGLEVAAGDASRSEDERKACARGIKDLDQAAIQTLHSFAATLLHERPLEAGLPPGFETTDDITAGIRFNEEWEDWIDDMLEEDSILAPHLALALTLDMTLAHLRSTAREFHENYADLHGKRFNSSPRGDAKAVETLLKTWPELERLCRYAKSVDDDALYLHVQSRSGAARRLADADPGSPIAYQLLRQMLPLRCSRGSQKDWRVDHETGINACKVLKERLNELHAATETELNLVRHAVLNPILAGVRQFALEYAEKRRSEGRAEFHDLLVWARDLLRDDIPVRDHFRGRFTHVLIDEVQDTDPIQAEIAMFLCEDVPPGRTDDARPRAWDQVEPRNGAIFAVGDPKQSIYRFRRADVAQMERVKERMALAGGRTVRLTQNFRSHRRLVAWVNCLFLQWMGQDRERAEDEGYYQAGYENMAPRWVGGPASGIGPEVWALSDVAVEGDIDGIRRMEATDIAALIRRMTDERWQKLDSQATEANGSETYTSVTYSDICILMPGRTGVSILQRSLEAAGIPYRLESASLIFETQEIRDLLNCLRAIDDPGDQVAVVAALRSPAFGCSDVDLFRHFQGGGGFDYLHPRAGRGAGPVSDALGVLSAYHSRRLWETPGSFIDRFVRDRGLMEASTGHPRMREQWRRYRFLVERARQFAGSGGTSLRAFLVWVEDQMNERARVTETPVPESDEQAVRVMTVHAAKGLEFPVVILTGINSERKSMTDALLVDRSSGSVEVRLGPKKLGFFTDGFEELAEREKKTSDAEYIRLMYVAATRARDHLVLSLRRRAKGGQKSPAGAISGHLAEAPGLWEPICVDDPVVTPDLQEARDDGLNPEDDVEHSVESREKWLNQRAALNAEMGRPSSVAATSLGGGLREQKGEPESSEPWRRGRAGTSVGRAVHAVLQSIDLDTGAGIDDRTRAQAAAEGIPGRYDQIARLSRVAVESAIVRRAVASRRFWREVPVAVAIGDGSLHGFIDLLFEEDGDLVVVDFKTDSVSAAEASGPLKEDYRLQGGAYAYAIREATGKEVKEMVFVYLQPRREVRVENLEGAMQDAASEAEKSLNGVGSSQHDSVAK